MGFIYFKQQITYQVPKLTQPISALPLQTMITITTAGRLLVRCETAD